MRMPRVVSICSLALIFVVSASASLRVGTLNCYFLVDPSRKPEGNLSSRTPVPEVYAAKVTNLASLIQNLDLVALQEVGSGAEAEALASQAGYRSFFVQGKDTYTGQDVATLVALRPELQVRAARRVGELGSLSKHLLLEVDDGGRAYVVLNVHLLRPIGRNEEKHTRQLQEIRAWVSNTQASQPNAIVVVLGDFNNPRRDLLPLTDSAELTGFAASHLDGKAFDRIFASYPLQRVAIVRPPYPKRPNDLLKSSWTDHFLIRAEVPTFVPPTLTK